MNNTNIEQERDARLFNKAAKLLEAFGWEHTDFSIYAYQHDSPSWSGQQILIGISFCAEDKGEAVRVSFHDNEVANSTLPMLVTDASWDLFAQLVRNLRDVNKWQLD